jgi:hypothetical protein
MVYVVYASENLLIEGRYQVLKRQAGRGIFGKGGRAYANN